MPLPPDATGLAAQARGYRTLLRACLSTPRCLSSTVWGFADRYQWVPGFFTGEGCAALYDERLEPKPAQRAVRVDLAAPVRRPG
jgi:endo-1,4-beta-xylanase